MFTALSILSGILWTITYVLIIRRGFLDGTYGMPLVALCANLSWEFIFAFVHPHGPVQRPINVVWFLLDAVILFQFLRYGPREFPRLPQILFYSMFALSLVMSFCAILFMTYEFGDYDGAYSAFGQNLLMSALFISMLYSRRSLRGQSPAIALCKLAGTALASAAFYFFKPEYDASALLPFLFAAILLLDVIYLLMIFAAREAQKAARARTVS